MGKPDPLPRLARRAWLDAMASPKPTRSALGSWDGCSEAEKSQWRAAVEAVVKAMDERRRG